MNTLSAAAVAKVAVLTVVLLSLSQVGPLAKTEAEAYSVAVRGCIRGENGPGVAFYLGTGRGCPKTFPSYPYLEIDIRQWPIPTGKPITIGPDNWAFRCPSSHEGCAQAISGTVVFDHSTDPTVERGIRSTGRYELKFQGDKLETGRFEIVCGMPCG